MNNYMTVEEKSVEWNITPRHVQYLCRNGKVEGAVKRVGAWFIPRDAQTPAKNTKSNVKGFNFVGTKNKIFDSAIELFVQKGFNNIGLRDIADDVGIRQSTIYNHFKSKQDILDTIYDFYSHFFLENRPSLEEMEQKLKNESVIDIIKGIRYDFKDEYQQRMADITKIIFQRIGIDSRAKEIGKSLMIGEGIQYVEDVFNMGVENGRFAPFDIGSMAVFVNSVRIFTLFSWIVGAIEDEKMNLLEAEQQLYKYASGFVVDMKPAIKDN